MSKNSNVAPRVEIDELRKLGDPGELAKLINTTQVRTYSESQPLVAIVIVNYNSAPDVKRCLESLSSLSYQRYFTVIVDGASPDGSGEVLRRTIKSGNVDIVLNPENAGFAASSNLGIRLALAKDAQFVWLLNPDVEVDPEALSSLLEASFAYPEVSAFGSKILYGREHIPQQCSPTSGEVIWSAGGTFDVARRSVQMRGSHEVDQGQYDETLLCDYLPGCSLFIRSSVLEKIGMLPEEYFMYFEETDWCHRVQNSGGELMFIPESRVWHHTSDDKMQSASTVYYYNRNNLLFWYRMSSPAERLKLLCKTLFLRLPSCFYAMKKSRLQPNADIFRAHFTSTLDFLIGRYGKRV